MRWTAAPIILVIVQVVSAQTPATQPAPATTRPVEAGMAVYVGEELLRDYRPAPALVTKQTDVPKPKFPAVDIHCHWTMRQEPAAMLAAMDDLGLSKAINLSGGSDLAQVQAMLGKFTAVAPDRLLIFCNIDFAKVDQPTFADDAVAFLRAAHAKGVRGLKVFKSLGLTTKDAGGRVVAIDDPRLDPIWRTCGELRMPVLIHSGDPTAFFRPIDARNERWMQLRRHPTWSFFGPEFPGYDEVMTQHVRMIERHPQTVFISAHLANSGEDLAKLSGWLERLPNLYVDISGRVAEIGRQPYAARRFLIRHQDRLMFGTDRYPGRPDQPRERIYYRFLETDDEYFDYHAHDFPPEGEWKIYGVFLPDDVLRKIYQENAERALRGEPPVK